MSYGNVSFRQISKLSERARDRGGAVADGGGIPTLRKNANRARVAKPRRQNGRPGSGLQGMNEPGESPAEQLNRHKIATRRFPPHNMSVARKRSFSQKKLSKSASFSGIILANFPIISVYRLRPSSTLHYRPELANPNAQEFRGFSPWSVNDQLWGRCGALLIVQFSANLVGSHRPHASRPPDARNVTASSIQFSPFWAARI